MQPTQPRDVPAERVSNGEFPEPTEGDRAVADAAVRVQPDGPPDVDRGGSLVDPALTVSAADGAPAPGSVLLPVAESMPGAVPPAAVVSTLPSATAAPATAAPATAAPATAAPANEDASTVNGNGPAEGSACTQAQLRRFIKSRPYVPMHELRRRFELNGEADDVNPVRLSGSTVYVGLPPRESGFLADLARQGEIGLELCHDPLVPVVVGVYPMRPVSR